MTSQRILSSGGLLLFLLSVGYGLFNDVFLLPARHQAIHYNLDMALNMAVKGDITMASAFAGQFAQESGLREIQARIPFHLALAGAMTAIPLWLTPRLDISERMKRIMALFIVAGGLVLAAGDFAGVAAEPMLGRYLVLAGYAWMALGLTGYLLYAGLFVWLHEEERHSKRG
ncbi:hypothetical protein [Anaeroselena agilis]|uniref:DUF998 domain-containing protein n=1 Tax=Anaeroselena agilis TaxID=3063788 RepID=A0ABU3P1N1_9FIRM|nr:hypothetical protein [Selenomonadales bacterium 4137-cl]